jgi:hypothetical protein
MAFSLGNILKSAASTTVKALSPAYNAVAKVYDKVKSLVPNASTTPAATSSPANSLFSVSGNTANGVTTNGSTGGLTSGISATATPSATSSSSLPSSSAVSGSSSVALAPMGQSNLQTPTVPSTIPSTSLSQGAQPVATVQAPATGTPVVTPFSSTPQATTSNGTTTTTTTDPNAIPSELMNPTSDQAIRDTQGRILDVSTQLGGKTAALAAAEVQAKVPEYQQQLNDVMSQINTLNSDAVAEQVKIEGKAIGSEFQTRQVSAVERTRVVKVLGLSAVASALQGNLSLARDYAQKAVDAKFSPLEAELETLKTQLEFNKDNYTRDEKVRADKLVVALDQRQAALEDARANQKTINDLAIEVAKAGGDAETLNTILNTDDLATALGAARGALAKKNGIGVYNLSEAQANIASKLADDFEKASGQFSTVRDAFGKIQSAQNGTGIADVALIFSYMKLLDPTSVVRENEQATVANAGGIPDRFRNIYNSVLTGEKLPETVRKEILNTSGSLYGKAQEIQNVVTSQYNDRATAYGIPSDLVTRDLSAGITGLNGSQQSGANKETIYAKLKTKYPTATEADLQSATQQFLNNPELQKQLGFNSDLGTSQNLPAASATSGTGMRTDRHNNPTAFTTDIAKNAGLVEGVDYVVGDAFPNNPNLKTAKLLGDPIATTIKVIDKIGFYTRSGNQRWDYIAIPASQWNAMSYDQKKQTIAKMYQHEGGTQLSTLFA